MAEIAIRGKQREASKGRTESGLPPLRVSYYRRMKPNRVYPAVVSWPDAAKAGAGRQVTVRLLAAGAQVVPSEQVLDSASAKPSVTFYVTPLARGWLGGERVEVLHDGRKIQEIPLRSNVVSQRSTWILLFLTLLVPAFIIGVLQESIPPAALPVERVVRNSLGKLPKEAKQQPTKPAPTKGKDKEANAEQTEKRQPTESTPKPEPSLLQLIHERAPIVVALFVSDLAEFSREFPLAWAVAGVLLILTLLSALMHREKTRSVWGKPLPIGEQAI